MVPLPPRIFLMRLDILLLLVGMGIGLTVFMSSTLTDQHAGTICRSVEGCAGISVSNWREEVDASHFRQVWRVRVHRMPGQRTVDVLETVRQRAAANVSWFASNVLFTVAPRIELQPEGDRA